MGDVHSPPAISISPPTHMLSGVSTICFVGSYLVALALEVTRLFFRSAVRGTLMLAFAGAGLLAQTAFLYYHAKETPGLPLSSPRDWCLVAAWAMVLLYLYLTYHFPKAHFGLFLLPIVLVLIGFGTWAADAEPFARGPASAVWGTIHGVTLLAASVSVAFGFVSGLMYLLQTRRLKKKRIPRRGLLLPSLEWLQRINARTIVISTILLGLGILSGGILIRLGGEKHIPWSDPVIVATLTLFLWLLGSSIVATFYHPAREGRKVAYLTVVNFVFLAVGLMMVFLADTAHGGRKEPQSIEQKTTIRWHGILPAKTLCHNIEILPGRKPCFRWQHDMNDVSENFDSCTTVTRFSCRGKLDSHNKIQWRDMNTVPQD